jgi:phosphoribosylamine--glycine ligase
VAPTRVLVVGGGGREHALAWKLAAEPGVNEVIVAPGSDAIATLARVRCIAGMDPTDASALVDLARAEAIELVVIGPEAPLAAGVADGLGAAGVPVFGPTAAAARIETSKAFCHEIAAATGVPMAAAASFTSAEERAARAYALELAQRTGWAVVKADGLAAGKGVTVCRGPDEAQAAVVALYAADPAPSLVIEERLVGREASVIALCDGRSAVALPPARDHKQLLDDDQGPNTGGMGAYSPLTDLPDAEAAAIIERFHRPVLDELARRGTPFSGALYAGLMLTDGGPVLLEFNARFGDPETQAILPRLAVPLGALLLAAARGELASGLAASGLAGVLPTFPGATVGIVIAAAGYPGEPRRGDTIDGLGENGSGLVFHAATALGADGAWRTAGGRVLTVVGLGDDLLAARMDAERLALGISFPGAQRRHDIGADPTAVAAGR